MTVWQLASTKITGTLEPNQFHLFILFIYFYIDIKNASHASWQLTKCQSLLNSLPEQRMAAGNSANTRRKSPDTKSLNSKN